MLKILKTNLFSVISKFSWVARELSQELGVVAGTTMDLGYVPSNYMMVYR